MFSFLNQLQNYPFFQMEILGNRIADWIFALVMFALALLVLEMIRALVLNRLRKFKVSSFKMAAHVVKAIHWPFYVFVSIYFASNFLNTHVIVQEWLLYLLVIFIIYYAIKAGTALIDFGANRAIEKGQGEEKIRLLSGIAKIFVWVIAIILLLENFGYNVTSLLAGLGITGIAVAFAAQQFLGDVIGAFAIYFDKPFKIGDKISVGEFEGIVTKIGIRSVRMKAPTGEEIIIANGDISKARIKNFGAR